MKNFIKNVLANIVAIGIVWVLVFFFAIFLLIVSAMSSSSTVKVKKNSVLTLDLNTTIIDSPGEDVEDIFAINSKNQNVILLDVINAIERAKNDDNIKGISIEVDHVNAGITQIDNLRNALEDFKKSGKFVTTYGNVVSQSSYYLGSVGQEYYLHPAGGIDLKGLSSEVAFYKDFADKYGVGIEVIRHGKYKSAVEPYLRNDLSDENKEQISVMLNDLWRNISTSISKSRKISVSDLNTVADSLIGMIPESALQNKLVDKLVQKSEYDKVLKSKIKLGADDKLNKISLGNYISTMEESSSGDKIGVLYASGAIYSGDGYGDIYSDNMIKDIRKLAKDKKIKAVVLRVNSPGGSANASDEILFELEELKKQKPLVVSFGDYAASGGYYIAMAGDRIFSEANTLTGSIGVFGVVPYFKELAHKNGITSEAVTTNANSNSYSSINGLTPGYVSMLTKSVEQTYNRFVHFVTKNRKKSFAQIDEVGGGRVWTGARAKSIGLVDEVGSLNDAIKFVGKKAGVKDYEVVSYPKKVTLMEQLFNDISEEQISTKLIKAKLGEENYKLFETLNKTEAKENIRLDSYYKVKL